MMLLYWCPDTVAFSKHGKYIWVDCHPLTVQRPRIKIKLSKVTIENMNN